MYGSAALTPVQRRYSQTEREGLAVLWGCEHFNHYLYDRHFIINTDHKPLLNMLSRRADPPARIQKWMMKLQAYDYELEHVPGKDMAADYLSRHPDTDENMEADAVEHFINMIVSHSVPKASTIGDIQAATASDVTLQKVINGVLTDKWDIDDSTRRFFQVRHSLSTKNGVLLKGNLLVIPQELQHDILELAHRTLHQGVEKTKAMLREKVWWPSINIDVENKIRHCHACQVTKPQDLKCQPLKMSEIPKTSWHTVAMDIQGPYPGGEYILLLVDYRSRYPVAVILKSITSQSVIKCISKTFAVFGYPTRVTTDNGPQFISAEFTAYLTQHGIEHRRVTPYWPAANGEVERMNRTIKRAIHCAVVDGKRCQDALHEFLLGYRTTPHSVTGVAPSKLLFKHELRNDIPFVDSKKPTKLDTLVNKRDSERKQKSKEFADKRRNARSVEFELGDQVLLKNLHKNNKLSTNFESTPYTVIRVYKSSVKIENIDSGKVFVRNKCHVKRYLHTETNTPIDVPTTRSTIPNELMTPGPAYWPLMLEEPVLVREEVRQPVVEEEDILELTQELENITLASSDDDFHDAALDETVAYEDESALPRYPLRHARRYPPSLDDFE